MTEELRYQIGERRICWPNPTDLCLTGACNQCNRHPFRGLGAIKSLAQALGKVPLAEYQYGLENNFFSTETRASKQDLEAYVNSIGVLALKEMATGMVGGTHGKSRAAVVAYVLRHRRDVLDESFRLTRRRTWKTEEISEGGGLP